MRVLVTGAGGFVGRALCALLKARGVACRRAVRASAGTEGAEFIAVGDIGPKTDWSTALAGCSAVVHLANLAHVPADSAELASVNVQGTRRLAQQASAAGVRRMIFMSSVKALCDESGGGPITESRVPEPTDDYGRAKLAAERALAEVAVKSGLETVILRPPLVYGPGVRANFLALMRAVQYGLPIPIGTVRNRRSLIYVGNLAHAVLCCLEASEAMGKTYLVADGPPVSSPDLARALAHALGRPQRLVGCPPRLLELTGTLIGRGAEVRRLTRSLELDDNAIRRELGWRPPYSFEQGLRATAEWYRARGS